MSTVKRRILQVDSRHRISFGKMLTPGDRYVITEHENGTLTFEKVIAMRLDEHNTPVEQAKTA